jgi:hypothetical protein
MIPEADYRTRDKKKPGPLFPRTLELLFVVELWTAGSTQCVDPIVMPERPYLRS